MNKSIFMYHFNKHGMGPYCVACGKNIEIGDKFERGSTGLNSITYKCGECAVKPILVYQPILKRERHNQKRKTPKPKRITYKEYLKKYCKCEGVICK